MKIALITGSADQQGLKLLNFYKKKFKVIGIDNDYRKFFGRDASTKRIKQYLKTKYKKNYVHFDSNISKIKEIEKIFKKYKNKIKLVIHSALNLLMIGQHQIQNQISKLMQQGTLNMLKLTKKYLQKKTPFIYMSTNKVYGDNLIN